MKIKHLLEWVSPAQSEVGSRGWAFIITGHCLLPGAEVLLEHCSLTTVDHTLNLTV